ncbi:MAG: inositol monophosphatase [Dehalococcoidia bacterium]
MTNDLTAIQQFRPETQCAFEAVESALRLAANGVGPEGISSKGERDLVTAADIAVEDLIREHLTGTLGLPVVGEELGGEAPGDGTAFWLVDPICGTRNFASGIPLYCVNGALVECGQVTIAVVGDPSTGEIVIAEQGRGAWAVRDGTLRRLTASDESRAIVVEDGTSKGPRREHAARFTAAVIRADRWYCRSFGTTLPAVYLAAGRIAACVQMWVPALHAAAGTLLITEAGGVISDYEGRPWSIQSDTLVASANAELQHELLTLLRVTAPQTDVVS